MGMRWNRLGLVLGLALASAGCLEIDTVVKLHEDGSGTITERLRLSRRLLDLGRNAEAGQDVASLLKKEAALDRMKHMGKGVSLVSYEVRDIDGGARESVAVFKIEDLSEFHYVSPFLAYKDYAKNNTLKCHLYPILKGEKLGSGYKQAGDLAIAFRPTARPVSESRPREGQPLPAGPTPQELQALRDLRPVFRDLLKDFKVKFRVEMYASIRTAGFGLRELRAAARGIDLIDFSGQSLDKYGYPFLDNEEAMLDLLRGAPGGPNVVEHTKEFPNNPTVPVFHPWGSMHSPYHSSDEVYFPPSRDLFKRHFEGKTLDFGRQGTRPAAFEEIGPK